ncbi:MAG TPA: flavodoxin domain-containing protein [Lachnospiraceae bacterium]|nr:flavodoxin domain-containing protein [Lachnospiraceae bacterium]
MKIVVVYKSKTGFTKRYAQWIAEELGCGIVEEKKASAGVIKDYSLVIYGGGIIAGQISGLKKFKLVASKENKKLIVFATGATSMDAKQEIDNVRNRNLPEGNEIPFFYFQSGINYNEMGFGGKMMMKMFTSMLEKKSSKTPEEQGQLDVLKNSSDFTKREDIEPLIKYVKEMK